MKTQKVEIELPYFEGYEFVEYGFIKKKHEIDCCYVYSPRRKKLQCVKNNSYIGEFHLIYRKKNPRKIIYEEIAEDCLKPGDFYFIDSDVCMWTSGTPSGYKRQRLKKVHDDFEVSND